MFRFVPLRRLTSGLNLNIRQNYSSDNSHATFENRNILKLKDRNLLVAIFPDKKDALEAHLAKSTQSVYCGFDPTASSLHTGNLLALISLMHCQRMGHTPIVVIGSATAMIGDPSGKKTQRDTMANDVIVHNSNSIQKQIIDIFNNHEKHFWKEKGKTIQLPKLKVLNNLKWYEEVNVIKFLNTYGKHLRMGDLLSRKQMKTRIESKEGISFMEFSYQMFQAYDWLYLLNNHDCTLQIGGNDQTGNMTTGHELIKSVDPKKCKNAVFAITLPIITNESGSKLGKSEGNAVWLDHTLYSAFDFYQFFVNTPDAMVETYLKLFTFIPISQITDLMREHRPTPEKYIAQKRLAAELTTLVHGNEGLESALKCTEALFFGDPESLAKMSESEIEMAFKGCKLIQLPMEPGLTVAELALKANCFRDIAGVMDAMNGNGLRMNNVVMNNPQDVLVYGQHILINNITVIKVGKKTFHIVKWLA